MSEYDLKNLCFMLERDLQAALLASKAGEKEKVEHKIGLILKHIERIKRLDTKETLKDIGGN